MSLAEAPRSSIDPADVARFSAVAAEWWDSRGKFAPLHRLNPARLAFIRDQALMRFGREGAARRPFAGLRLLDIGCGGGLLCEPMTRLGFAVTGIDASAETVGVASAHARELGLAIDYRATTAENLAAAGETFDVVLNMEVIEHVADPRAFLRDCAALLAPGGIMILATLNRTAASLALAKIGAEYILRWVPAGTHDWNQFLKPEEIRAFAADLDVAVDGPFGLAFDPIAGTWSRSTDARINYMMTLAKPARQSGDAAPNSSPPSSAAPVVAAPRKRRRPRGP
jgi:2-polyprenyl-6-hydroxyphenyl methylase/3-demethylubiquinone-9 3-methyltransferase